MQNSSNTMENYSKYKRLKRRFSIKYRGINIAQVLALDLWNWTIQGNIMEIPVVTNSLSVDFSFLKEVKKPKIIYFDMGRNDHEATFYSICSRLSSDYEIINISNQVPHIEYISKKNRILARFIVKWSTRRMEYSEEEQIHMAYRVCLILNSIDNLHKNAKELSNIKHFVAYSAIHTWGNLLGQYFRKRGTTFWGLSHASHMLFQTNIPIDCLNYENLDVDYNVTWGQYTKDEYLRYGVKAKEIFVAGYPKNITLNEVRKCNNLKTCIVLLARSNFDSSNIKLLNILCKSNKEYSFFMKLHPSCNFSKYKSYAEKNGLEIIDEDTLLTECLDNRKYDFGIAVNTTSYYEVMAVGIPCLRFEDDKEYDLTYGNKNDAFHDEYTFQFSMKWLAENVTTGEYGKKSKDVLKYVLGLGEDNYSKILS